MTRLAAPGLVDLEYRYSPTQNSGRARNLGDAQAGKIRGDLTDQFEIGGGKLATGKGQ